MFTDAFENELDIIPPNDNSNFFCENNIKNEFLSLESFSKEILEVPTFEDTEGKNKFMKNYSENIFNEDINIKEEKIEMINDYNNNFEINLLEKKRKKEINNKEILEKEKKKRKPHDKKSKDNMKKKYRTYCFDFGKDLLNDCFKKENGGITEEMELKELNRNMVYNNDASFNLELMNRNLEELYKSKISKKWKLLQPTHNKKIIEFIIREKIKYPKSFELLKKNFSELSKIYNNLNNEAQEYFINKAKTFDIFLTSLINKKGDKDYIENFRKFGYQFVEICMNTKPRKKKN